MSSKSRAANALGIANFKLVMIRGTNVIPYAYNNYLSIEAARLAAGMRFKLDKTLPAILIVGSDNSQEIVKPCSEKKS